MLRTRAAVDALAGFRFDRGGNRVWRQARALLDSEYQRLAVGQVAVPFGACSEPSKVQAGGGACPFRFRCLGCGHFRSDPSYLPELRDYHDTLLRTRERVRSACDLEEWARTDAMPSEAEITRLRQLIRQPKGNRPRIVRHTCRAGTAQHASTSPGETESKPDMPDSHPERTAELG